ncbi:response regulator transcription factor [Pseudaminobacter soli (ex Li et al. 2025)]|uniref:DNA-binding response regulator n=1 Tax=Pseudaminobacter soli (ex Li et al. 2025) TaxID=1295366 RepID=A0A2P7RSN3_9HYPH|nr:response regulator transcription factor [Mesorhizobium soli]PSJ53215.1 DNA-binding response regulator [Mesorhizobium soli]
MRILLVEDDKAIGGAVRDHAGSQGHAVDWSKSLAEAEELASVIAYELVLLDLHLPDGNGLSFLKTLRDRADAVPVIVLTARDQISDRIAGLNAGADDYLVKPFNLDELSARIHAVARRYGQNVQPRLAIGALRIAPAERIVTREDRSIDLTAREWAVLDRLLSRQGAIVSKAQIEDALYELGAEVESNTVEVYVSRLRKKLGGEIITTVRGVGYRITNT